MATAPAASHRHSSEAGTNRLVEEITAALAKIPGVTDVQLVGQDKAPWTAWGFLYEGNPQSMSWNATP